ncbi:hypothetical protein C9374_008157 [Naegleria lovaniensis]|uniref:Uncharacterized protein n=1 Tax=Naegleria lovaniensis TaxID=51637 RepID=A0AA88GLR6_NAELO|nr:uncharacterized protein C9374_008157 [Naegleria lovaniensis]KAG2378518.1 hypothetical protein C9374_008157 [Naegleria lovaniensis]
MDVFYSSSSSSSGSFSTVSPVVVVPTTPSPIRSSSGSTQTATRTLPSSSSPTKRNPLQQQPPIINTPITSSYYHQPQSPHETRATNNVVLPPLLQPSFSTNHAQTSNFVNISTAHNNIHKPVPVATITPNLNITNNSHHHQQRTIEQVQPNEAFILPPVSALLQTPPPTYSLQSTNTSIPSSPFKVPSLDSYRNSLASPVSSSNHEFSNDQISSAGCSTMSTDFEHQKKAFQNYVKNVAIREEKQVVKMGQEQQVALVLKVLKHNQLRMAQALESSPRSHHTISAQLLENGRILDVYVFIRKKPNCVIDRKTFTKEFRLENFSFNVVVLGKKSQNNVHRDKNQQTTAPKQLQ